THPPTVTHPPLAAGTEFRLSRCRPPLRLRLYLCQSLWTRLCVSLSPEPGTARPRVSASLRRRSSPSNWRASALSPPRLHDLTSCAALIGNQHVTRSAG